MKDIINVSEYFQILDKNDIHLISGTDKSIPQPPNITLKLKNYQRATIYQMFLREQKNGFFIDKYNFLATNIGVIGEDVGAGKTFITLGLISYKKTHKFYYPNNPSSFVRYQLLKHKLGLHNMNENFIKNIINYLPKYSPGISIIDDYYLTQPSDIYLGNPIENLNNLKNLSSNLIVLPHNLIRQWKNDIITHTNLTYFFISSIRDLRKIKENGIEILNNYDIVLCNASKYNDLTVMSKNYRWERVFFDEAHSIYIPKSNFIFAKFYWFITATPKSVIKRGNTGFLTELFKVYFRKLRQQIDRDGFNKFILKTNSDCVKKEYILPEPYKTYHLSKTPLWFQLILKNLPSDFNQQYSGFNMKMMYAEMISELKQYFYNVTHITIYHSELIEKNIILIYLKFLISKMNVETMRIRNFQNDQLRIRRNNPIFTNNVKREIERKEKLINKYIIKKNEYTNCHKNIITELNNKNICFMCLEKYDAYYILSCPTCTSKVCKNCKDKYINWTTQFPNWGNNCLNCCEQGIIDIQNKGNLIIKEEDESQLLTKTEHVFKLISDNPDSKFLIFSNFNQLFEKYKKEFKNHKIKFGVLKGNNLVINKRLRDFKSGEVRILMLNGKFYGSGLNLQDATDIIITHKISQDVETQVVGRANRMGRIGQLKIHYLMFEGEHLH